MGFGIAELPRRDADEADEADEPMTQMDEGGSQAQASQTAHAAISPEEADTLAKDLCRLVLLREHTKKPIPKADLKTQILKDRADRSGKIMKQVVARANEMLLDIAGLELVLAAEESDDASTQAEASQAAASQSQAPSQAAKSSASASKYLLVNKLANAVSHQQSDASLVYQGFVEVVLQLLLRNQGGCMKEDLLYAEYLPKLGLQKDHHLPHQSQKVEDLIGKRMVSEAYLKKRKNNAGENEFVPGARAQLTRSADNANTFHDSSVMNRAQQN